MGIANIILEYIKVFLSSQVVAGLVAVVLIMLFRKDISSLLTRIATIRFPGGELSTSQAAKLPEPEIIPDQTLAPEEVELSDVRLSPEQFETVRNIIVAEQVRAVFWEFKFLNYFLVQHTQEVLHWFASIKNPPTDALYEALWLPKIPSPEERKAVIDALLSHTLVSRNGPLLEITEKGKQYCEFRRAFPSKIA